MFEYVRRRRDELIEHYTHNLGHNSRNKRYFFSDMARYIRTKSDSQCKSRFQKRELEIFAALDFPPELLKSLTCNWAMARRKIKKKTNEVVTGDVSMLEELEEEQKSDDVPKSNRDELNAAEEIFAVPQHNLNDAMIIRNYEDLRRVIGDSFLYRVENPAIREQIETFLQKLPQREEFVEDIPSLCMHSVSGMLNISLTFRNALQMTLSFLED